MASGFRRHRRLDLWLDLAAKAFQPISAVTSYQVLSSGPYRTRTCDPLRVMQVRYQLRQRPVRGCNLPLQPHRT